MTPEVTQRAAERLILEFARRMCRRLGVSPNTPIANVALIGLAKRDPVAVLLAEDAHLRRIADGFWRPSARDRADAEALEAIKILTIADTMAERDIVMSRLSPVERERRKSIDALVAEARAAKAAETKL